jgi:hypothetical protein
VKLDPAPVLGSSGTALLARTTMAISSAVHPA